MDRVVFSVPMHSSKSLFMAGYTECSFHGRKVERAIILVTSLYMVSKVVAVSWKLTQTDCCSYIIENCQQTQYRFIFELCCTPFVQATVA